MTPEKRFIENHIKPDLEKMGFDVHKFSSPFKRGFPDIIAVRSITKTPSVLFLEAKRSRTAPRTVLQIEQIRILQEEMYQWAKFVYPENWEPTKMAIVMPSKELFYWSRGKPERRDNGKAST